MSITCSLTATYNIGDTTMIIEDCPWCCAARIIGDLDNYPEDDDYDYDYCFPLTKESMRTVIRDYGKYMLIATTIKQQTKANKLLREFGFTRTQFHKKDYNKTTALALWHRDPKYTGV